MVSKSWIKKLVDESKKWVDAGLIDSGHEARINAFYKGQVEYKRLINTVTSLGSILIGLGILLFVASNWQYLSRPTKISIIFFVIAFFHLTGFYFRYIKNKYFGLGEGFLLIGAFAFGAGVWLIAQMYHIHYNFSAGILFWILGILPVVVIFRSWTVLVLSAILSFIWLSSYQIYYLNREVYGFLVLLTVLVALCYSLRQRFSLFVMVAAFAEWLFHFWVLKCFPREETLDAGVLIPQIFLVTAYIFLGCILYGVGIWHERSNRYNCFSFLYKFLGVIFVTASAYSLTFAHHYYKDSVAVGAIGFRVLCVILFFISLAILYRLYKRAEGTPDAKEAQFLLMLFLLAPFSLVLSLVSLKAASVIYNLILLVQVFVFMYLGFVRHSEGIFRLAIIVFFIDILSRYFDTFWKMMPRSLLFIFGGIILIVGAVFADQTRRKIEAKMQQGGT